MPKSLAYTPGKATSGQVRRTGTLMRELIRTNDAVLLSFVESLLRDAGIAALVADQNISIVEGSIGVFPRRVQVRQADWGRATEVLTAAGLGGHLVQQ